MDINYREINQLTVNAIKDQLIAKGETAAVAESVTAGNLQVALSLAENAADFFQGGITTYNIGQKARHLHINPIHALTNNCVSEKVAKEMASCIPGMFSADWGIAITGYASPLPEKNITDLFACYAIFYRQDCLTAKTIRAERESPIHVRYYYTNTVLASFLAAMRS